MADDSWGGFELQGVEYIVYAVQGLRFGSIVPIIGVPINRSRTHRFI